LAENILQAKRYSQAVFEIAQERKELDKWLNDLQKMVVLTQYPEFVSVMANPKFPFANKSQLLGSQLKEVSPMAMNLANILTAKGSFGLINNIYAGYQELLDKFRGIEKADITTAVPLEEKDRIKLGERLSSISGRLISVLAPRSRGAATRCP